MVSKFSLRLPSGLEIAFEGDGDALDQFKRFAESDLPALIAKLGPVKNSGSGISKAPAAPDHRAADDPPEEVAPETVDIAALAQRLDELSANTDIERATAMAFAAHDAGLPGLSSELADTWYTAIGLPKPGVWRSTFQNAKNRGYLQSVGHGTWKPTVAGENFARHGIRKTSAKRRTVRRAEPGGN